VIPPLAHAGHVLVELPIYLGPVVLLIAWFKFSEWRQKAQGAGMTRPAAPERAAPHARIAS